MFQEYMENEIASFTRYSYNGMTMILINSCQIRNYEFVDEVKVPNTML